ncbi:hypothetical protein M9434_001000 [Picochlorum sp. BPE23]|nr:hypothetical protein M9434_001000 [Picochlorum sp. BPE23]
MERVDVSVFEGVDQAIVAQGILKYLHNARNVERVVNVLLCLRHAGVLGVQVGSTQSSSSSRDVHAYGFLRYRLKTPECRTNYYDYNVQENSDLDLLYDKVIFMAHRSHRLGLIDAVFDMALIDGCRVSSKMVGRLASCLREYDGEKAYYFYCHAVERGWRLDAFAYKSIVINMLADGTQYWRMCMDILQRFHMSMPYFLETNLHTSIAVTCGKNGWFEEMIDLYYAMLRDGVEPNTITWNAFITACQRLHKPRVGFEFGDAMRAMDVPMDVNTYSSLLACAAAMRDETLTIQTWNSMIDDNVRPDRIVCGGYMWALLESSRPDLAVDVFEKWKRDGRPPGSSETHSIELEYFHQVSKQLEQEEKWSMHRKALRIQRWMRSQGVKPESIGLRHVVDKGKNSTGLWKQAAMLAKMYLPLDSADLLPSVAAYSFAIIGYHRLRDEAKGLELAREFEKLEMQRSTAEYATALNACAHINALEPALKLIKRARGSGVKLSPQAFTSAISICSARGSADSALWLLREMTSSGIKPNEHTINCVLTVCGATGRVSGALKLFQSMEASFGVKPDMVCFATMWEILGARGNWWEAAIFYLVGEGYVEASVWPYARFIGSDGNLRSIDLHLFSVVGSKMVIRIWLLLLRDAHRRGSLQDNQRLAIITGRGKNSPDGQSRIKPSIEEFLSEGLGVRIPWYVEKANKGQICIKSADLKLWFENEMSSIGLGSSADEDVILKICRNSTNADLTLLQQVKVQ